MPFQDLVNFNESEIKVWRTELREITVQIANLKQRIGVIRDSNTHDESGLSCVLEIAKFTARHQQLIQKIELTENFLTTFDDGIKKLIIALKKTFQLTIHYYDFNCPVNQSEALRIFLYEINSKLVFVNRIAEEDPQLRYGHLCGLLWEMHAWACEGDAGLVAKIEDILCITHMENSRTHFSCYVPLLLDMEKLKINGISSDELARIEQDNYATAIDQLKAYKGCGRSLANTIENLVNAEEGNGQVSDLKFYILLLEKAYERLTKQNDKTILEDLKVLASYAEGAPSVGKKIASAIFAFISVGSAVVAAASFHVGQAKEAGKLMNIDLGDSSVTQTVSTISGFVSLASSACLLWSSRRKGLSKEIMDVSTSKPAKNEFIEEAELAESRAHPLQRQLLV